MQFSKAAEPISCTVEGIVTLVMFLFPLNAELAIFVTLFPLGDISGTNNSPSKSWLTPIMEQVFDFDSS